ncbi:MAG: S41 family peptidase, partial [Patescibacteria group bacterium]
MNSTRVTAAGVLLAVVLAFGAGMYAGVSGGAGMSAAAAIPGTAAADLAQFWRVWELLESNHIETGSSTNPTEKEKIYGAIKGLTESYGDPYTVFLPPQEAKEFNEEISGTFSGGGMELGIRDDALTVVSPIKGTPAERAGVLSGDIVLSINGAPSSDMAVEEAVKKIRGEKGTSVTIVFGRKGVEKPIELTLVRDTINIPLITTSQEGDTFTIELYSFSANSPELFRTALREFVTSRKHKLILDLRGNPGGYLEASVQMASYFLPVGEVVVTEDYKGNRPNIVHRSVGYNVFAGKNLKMAV